MQNRLRLCFHLLQSCIRNKDLSHGKLIHAHIYKMGCPLFPLLNTLMNMYIHCGSLEDARTLFDRVGNGDVYSWTLMLSAYVRYGMPLQALSLFRQMQGNGLQANHFTFSSILTACASVGSLRDGVEIHTKIIVKGFSSDIVVSNALIDMYAKCGSVWDSRQVFDKMPQRDIVSWTAMIAGYGQNGLVDDGFRLFKQLSEKNVVAWNAMISGFAQNGCEEEALGLLRRMQFTGMGLNSKTLATILPACANLGGLEEGMEIHGKIIRRGLECNVVLVNALIDMYAKCGILLKAKQLFDRSNHLDVVSWNAMIAGFVQKGLVDEAFQLFYKMPRRDVISWNTMIAGFVQNGFVEEAMMLFNGMPHKTVVSWNTIITGLGQNGYSDEVLKLLRQMVLVGGMPDSRTFAGTLSVCAKMAGLKQGMEIHGNIVKRGLQWDVMLMNSLIDMYAKSGSLKNAYVIFNNMHQKDVVSWNAIIAGYSQNGLVEKAVQLFLQMPRKNVISWNTMITAFSHNGPGEEALKLFKQMQTAGVMPDSKTLASILAVCASFAALDLGMEVHEKALINGFQSNVFVTTALLDMYAQCGCIDKSWELFKRMDQGDPVSWNAMITGYAKNGLLDMALKLFKQMPQQNTDSWNAMIAGLAQNGCAQEALKLFQQMLVAGMRPDSKTFITTLPACANLASVEHGIEIHQEIIRSGLQSDVKVVNALIDMYAKSGSIQKARELFDKLNYKDVVSWNTMIGGYAICGCGKEAIELFDQMELLGTHPNHVTLLSILTACSHAGLVQEGCRYFDRMHEYYNLTPALEHYICIVDLLGRSGHLAEAHEFINKMPLKPDVSIWSCLLGFCRTHKNIELGAIVAKHLLELDPENATPYVFLSNIYAITGRWHEIGRVRKMMKEYGVKKMPGCSWIEVKKVMHAFVVGGRPH